MGPYFWGTTHLTPQELQFIGDLKGLGFRLQGLGLSDARCPPASELTSFDFVDH